MSVGLPATVANGTNRVGVFVQCLTAVAGFRQEGISELRVGLRLLPPTLLGSWLGAWTASVVPDALFARGFGLVMLLMLPVLIWNPSPRQGGHGGLGLPLPAQLALYGALGFYGGAVQAGIGIPLLLALVAVSGLGLVRAASARVFLVAALTLVALAQFIYAGKVAWVHAAVLAAGSGAGGYLAARFGARVGDRVIRPALVIAVIGLAFWLLLGPA
jgi:uncharacterized membrane protein YfcA